MTLLARVTGQGLGPCLAVEEATTSEVFEAYLGRVLAPSLRPGQVVIMDNLSAHKGAGVKEIVEGRGGQLLCLPPYSPDLNPIEQAFSKIKGFPRHTAAGRSWKRWVGRWTTYPPKTPVGSSRTAATATWANRYDERARVSSQRSVHPDADMPAHSFSRATIQRR